MQTHSKATSFNLSYHTLLCKRVYLLQYMYLNWMPTFSQITQQILIEGQRNLLHCASIHLCDISFFLSFFLPLCTFDWTLVPLRYTLAE